MPGPAAWDPATVLWRLLKNGSTSCLPRWKTIRSTFCQPLDRAVQGLEVDSPKSNSSRTSSSSSMESNLFADVSVISRKFATRATVSLETATPSRVSGNREERPGQCPRTRLQSASWCIVIVTSSFGADIQTPILLFLRNNPSSFPHQTSTGRRPRS